MRQGARHKSGQISFVSTAASGPLTSSDFKYGGWTAPFFHDVDEAAGELMEKQMKSADLLLGRKTFDIFYKIFYL